MPSAIAPASNHTSSDTRSQKAPIHPYRIPITTRGTLQLVECSPPAIHVTPSITESVGHGRSPNGDAYAYVVHASVLRKCGYVHPKATSAAPASSEADRARVTVVSGRRVAPRRSSNARTANVRPLKGLRDTQATTLTETAGTTSR